ncbi:MAG: caspase family protein [Spirochaetales bacterium]|nr:caspase family protein [Spirochaetales bacterium]
MYDIILEACNLVKKQNEETETVVTNNNNNNNAVTMHFIMAAATLDKTIGKSVKTDLNLAEPEFKRFAEQLKINYNEYIISDKNFNRDNILKAIKSIKPSPNDIIVFLYSGHGFRFDDDTDEYPNMFLTYKKDLNKNDYLGVSEVYNMLTAKKARMTIVLSDCCNSYYGATRREVDSSALTTRGLANYNLSKLEKLFIKSSGTIKITAAKAGQYALCDAKGGFLLTSFLNNIHSMVSAVSTQEPSWQTITDNAREYVKRKTTGFDETGKDTDPQIVVKSVNVNDKK